MHERFNGFQKALLWGKGNGVPSLRPVLPVYEYSFPALVSKLMTCVASAMSMPRQLNICGGNDKPVCPS
jgi:hypothetical protein